METQFWDLSCKQGNHNINHSSPISKGRATVFPNNCKTEVCVCWW